MLPDPLVDMTERERIWHSREATYSLLQHLKIPDEEVLGPHCMPIDSEDIAVNRRTSTGPRIQIERILFQFRPVVHLNITIEIHRVLVAARRRGFDAGVRCHRAPGAHTGGGHAVRCGHALSGLEWYRCNRQGRSLGRVLLSLHCRQPRTVRTDDVVEVEFQ